MRITGKNILIIDDDGSLRTLLRKILETAGYVVDEAGSVRDSVERITTKLPDLVVLDLSMPEHDGFAFLKFREQNKLFQSIPVLVLSAAKDKRIVQRALAMGAQQYVEKPLKANLILQKIRYLFSSTEHFSHTFPDGQIPTVRADMNGLIIGAGPSQIKVSCPAKFEKGRPVRIHSDSYAAAGGGPLVGRIDNRIIEVNEGLYEQVLTLAGISPDEQKRYDEWRRRL